MYRAQPTSRKYEEHAYVLDFNPRGKSTTVRGREGIIITAIGEDRLTLLEVLGIQNSTFEVGENIYIGKDGRTKISSVLGGTIATADAVCTAKVGTTNMTNGAITITQSGSAAGDIDTCEPTAANNVSEGDFIAIATNGASTGTHSAHFTIVIRR